MVERVNFVGGSKYGLTYRNMAIGVGLWALLGVGVHLGLVLHTSYVRSHVSTLKERIRVLQGRQDQQLQVLAVTKTQEQTGTAIKNLASAFHDEPRWSQLLVKLGEARTPGLALQQVSGTPDEKENGTFEIQFTGTANTMDAVNTFVGHLDGIALFHQVELAESTRDVEAAGLRFVVKAHVRFEGS